MQKHKNITAKKKHFIEIYLSGWNSKIKEFLKEY